jgi:hypothetical protein
MDVLSDGRFVATDVLSPRMFCPHTRFVHGRFVSGRFVSGRFVWAPVEHQMIYSPERKNNGYILNITSHFLNVIQLLIVTIFSLCWLLILLYHVRNWFSYTSPYVFPISAGFQLTLFPGVRWAGSLTPCLSVDWFQEALDSGNCLFHCRAHYTMIWQCTEVYRAILQYMSQGKDATCRHGHSFIPKIIYFSLCTSMNVQYSTENTSKKLTFYHFHCNSWTLNCLVADIFTAIYKVKSFKHPFWIKTF